MVVCAICLATKEAVDMQTLSCAHTFCRECMTHCTASQLCPAPFCTYIRRVNVVIDEADEGCDEGHQKVKLGPKLPSMLQLEERQRCDGRRGAFACVNAARMTLNDCCHRLCFDCLSSRIKAAIAARELPYCPIFLCANRLTASEIAKVAERAGSMRKSCADVIHRAPEASPEEPPGKDECVLYCSVYHSEGTVRSIIFPTACTVLDIVTAMIQVQHLKKFRTAHNIGVFIKTTTGGKPKYDAFDVKALSKKKICDAEIHEGTHFVLDVDSEIK
uniref:RING-type domain-containing protein n=1 Tax=Parascaris univalens TaxID=6257 RepID=A0A915AGC8_PARUN